MSLLFVCSAYCCLQVTKVIEAVKNTDDVDSVCSRFLYEVFYNVICIWTVSKDVLSTEEHLKFCVFEAVT